MITAALVVVLACAPSGDGPATGEAGGEVAADAQPRVPLASIQTAAGTPFGAPLAVAVDFENRVYVVDASPARIVGVFSEASRAQEFGRPPTAGFHPTDVAIHGFFVYAIDSASRTLLRFDTSGSFRDVLLNFEQLVTTRRVSPFAIAVDETGRMAVTDIENHQVLLIDNYLQLNVSFGNYGSFPGQLNTPRGVAFSPRREIIVTDTFNRRIQYFSDGGAFLRVVPATDVPNPLVRPRRAVESSDGRVYVADPGAGAVFVFTPSGARVGAFTPQGAARFEPTDVEAARDGRVLVVDAASPSLYVFEAF